MFLQTGKYPPWTVKQTQRRNFRRLAAKFTLLEGRLAKSVKRVHPSGRVIETVVPVATSAAEVAEAAASSHNGQGQGVHFGVKGTMSQVQQQMFWRGMRQHVSGQVCACVDCVDHRLKQSHAPWTRIVCSAPLELVINMFIPYL